MDGGSPGGPPPSQPAADATPLRPPPPLPPRWRPERLLGTGGQAEVWLARDLELDVTVAVKVFRDAADGVSRERLRREVRLGRSLQHPRLVRLHELIESGPRPAVVMEWIPGGSLADRLAAGPLSVAEVVAAAEQVLETLAYLHENGVVHRDVKPSNLLLAAPGDLRLADFGLARPQEDGAELTRTSMTVGTLGFMSPEQIQGRPVGPSSDLYALGVTLFQLLTRQPPFRGSSAFEVAHRHLKAPPPSPARIRSECPAWLGAFVLRLLEKRPEDRFSSAAEALAALRLRRPAASPRARRRRLLAGAAAVALCASGAFLWKPARTLLFEPVAARVVAERNDVVGLGSDGRTLFRSSFAAPVVEILESDLDGDGRSEAIVSSFAVRSREPGTEVAVLDRRGRVVTRLRPGDALADWPRDVPKTVLPKVARIDLTGDGRAELVVVLASTASYPSALLVYWPSLDHWEQLLLHSGHIYEVALVPRSRPARLRLVATNNRMGHVVAAAELELVPPALVRSDSPRRMSIVPGGSPRSAAGKVGIDLRWYTLVGETCGRSAARFDFGDDGRFAFECGDSRAVLDPLGNPVPGPNAGRESGVGRLALLDAVTQLHFLEAPATASEVERLAARVRQACGDVLLEPYSRAALEIHVALALCRIGEPRKGAELLAPVAEAVASLDVRLHLTELLAFSGDLAAARAQGEALVGFDQGGHSALDGPLLLLRILVELHDEDAYRELAGRFARSSAAGLEEISRATLAARAHLSWDRLGPDDTRVESTSALPDGEALAALARWRLGRSAPDDPDRMAAAAAKYPDAALECGLARSAALLGTGRPLEALRDLDALAWTFGREATQDFGKARTMDLVRALRTKALHSAGAVEDALREARHLRQGLPPGLLARHLVDEVLVADGSSRGTAR